MENDKRESVFTPGNEPYLGRQWLLHFDKLICSCLEQNGEVAPKTHGIDTSDVQQAACQLIPQGISIALSIRELIRQGYLFGALMLVRPLAERAVILLYLDQNPTEIAKWTRGWRHDEAPSLSKMLESLKSASGDPFPFKGHEVTSLYNSLLHAKPDCAFWSVIPLEESKFGHTPSKMLNSPSLCDEICSHAIPWLVCVQCMIKAYFPDLSLA